MKIQLQLQGGGREEQVRKSYNVKNNNYTNKVANEQDKLMVMQQQQQKQIQ